MRILLAAKHAPHGKRQIGGVQTWSRTVAAELLSRGYEVETWGPEQPPRLGGFDLGIFANVSDTRRAWNWCRKRINVCHGIIDAESPVDDDSTKVVFTSEEVRDHWRGDGPVIRQPIDVDFWSPDWNLNISLTRFSYRSGLRFVEKLAKTMGYQYTHIRNASAEHARSMLRQSVCVLASGRAALEAMACDAPVVICDHRAAYQGPLLETNIMHAMVRNYSGRGGVVPTFANLRDAIEKAIERGGRREHVVKHHHVATIVDQLLEVAGIA